MMLSLPLLRLMTSFVVLLLFSACMTAADWGATGDKSVDFVASQTIDSDWGDGYCAEVVVTNHSSSAGAWDVTFEIDGVLREAWNANVIQSGTQLRATGLSWNEVLAPGGGTSFGYCALRERAGPSEDEEGGDDIDDGAAIHTGGATAQIIPQSDWESGYCADVVVTNETESLLRWLVSIEVEGAVTDAWSAEWSQDGTVLTAHGLSWNAELEPDGTAMWGFCARRDVVPPVEVDEDEPVDEDSEATDEEEPWPGSGGVVSTHGQLQVVGSELRDERGAAIQLRGMSSHGLQWYGHSMNARSMEWLRDDWGATVVRAAMYTAEGGYITDPGVASRVIEVVDAAVDLDLYVIIDWHILYDNDPNTYRDQARAFFEEMARLYGDRPNVIYEICNEPNGYTTWSGHIRPYAEHVIPAIRAIDPDNIIVVGTPTWSQDVHRAADDPLADDNIMYAVHFYAGTHGAWLRDRIDDAMDRGLAVFVTEWGASAASGDGGVYLTEAQAWIDFMTDRNVSWANWSLCDKRESSAALVPGASTEGGWSDADLSESGRFVRLNMR